MTTSKNFVLRFAARAVRLTAAAMGAIVLAYGAPAFAQIEIKLGHVGDFALGLRDDDRHVGLSHPPKLVLLWCALERW